METSKRHGNISTQREFERLNNKKSSGTITTPSVTTPGGVSAGKDKGTPYNLRVQKDTVTVVPATNQLDFTDTLSALWTIVRQGTKAIISLVVHGIMPDGTLDQTLRHAGGDPKNWVASSRLKTRHDTAVVSTGELGTVEITSVSGDDTPTLYVNGVPANNVATIVTVNADYQAFYSTTTGHVRPVAQADAASHVEAVGFNGNCSLGKGVYGWTTTGWGCYGDATSGKAVYGTCTSGYGVFGIATSGTGVYGESEDNIGVYAYSQTDNALYAITDAGVIAINGVSGGSNGTGVYGQCNFSNGIGTLGYGVKYGSQGISDSGVGVRGDSTDGIGGNFVSTNGYGISVLSTNEKGGYIESTNDVGLHVVGGAGNAITTDGSIDTNYHYKVGGTRVVSAQVAAIANAAGGLVIDIQARAVQDLILAALRSHGLIAT